MDNGRNLDISGLDELLLGALTDGLELHEILESLYSLSGIVTAILDTGGLDTVCVPERGQRQDELKHALRTMLTSRDERSEGFFRGRVAEFAPGEAGKGPAFCRLVPAGREPRHILAISVPEDAPDGMGKRALERAVQLYEYFDSVPSWEPGGYKASYLESGVARELLLGYGDLSRSVFGNLYDLRLDGEAGTSLGGGYVFAAIECPGDTSALPEAEQSLSRMWPRSFHLISDGRLLALFCSVREGEWGPLTDKLRFLTEGRELCCGVSELFSDLNERGGFRRQALGALSLALLPDSAGVRAARDSYHELMLAGALSQVGPTVLVPSEIKKLSEYDERNHTEYLDTLEKYLFFGNRLSSAAASMFIDRSTMKYRLQKIEDLIGVDTEDPDAARRLQIGIAVFRLSRSLPGMEK